jgi:hypothetical protein
MPEDVKTAEIVPANGVATPAHLLQIAVAQGADIDKLKQLMDLQERFEVREARKAFVAAMNKFKSNPPDIKKNKLVQFDTSKGQTSYRHATLDHVCDEVTKGLSGVGITHAWKVGQEKDGLITVTCVLTHELGHSETTQLMGFPDDSGGKNKIQAIGSTCSYLQRYTLLAACGLAAGDDNDGRTETKGMAAEELEKAKAAIAKANTPDELKAAFTTAFKQAQSVQDRKALADIIHAKDMRKVDLEAA